MGREARTMASHGMKQGLFQNSDEGLPLMVALQ
jgi:hypothetical protein